MEDASLTALKWFLIIAAIVGIILFLYGANYGDSVEVYDPVVGWAGVAVFVASVVGLLFLYVSGELAKRDQKP